MTLMTQTDLHRPASRTNIPTGTCIGTTAAGSKWSFAARHAAPGDAVRLDTNLVAARSGDLVLAEVTRVGNHKRLQLADGRFSPLWPGDRIVVACADRYAVDQFHGLARLSEEGADLLAGGGIAGEIVSRNDRVSSGTRLAVLGRLADGEGVPLNVDRYALPPAVPGRPGLVIAVLGTGMNAGKTAACAGLVNGFARLGRRVAAIKATGTGSFGDLWEYDAAGAARVLDFTDVGMASTYRQPPERIVAGLDQLLAHAANCDVAVVELADGVSQVETAALLSRRDVVARFDGAILAVPEAMAARGGLSWLAERGIAPLALTGLITRAPLAAEEAAEATGLPVLCRMTLADPATASALEARLADLDRSAA
jgi:molybdopterin-guanine dinucleotide biosynthesis protein